MFSGDYVLKYKKYDVVDEPTGKVVKTFDDKGQAQSYDDSWHHRI